MKTCEGFVLIESAFVYDPNLNDSEKIMLGKIHGYCKATKGSCFLTASELGNQLLWDKRKAQRIILALERRGYIIRECEGDETALKIVNSVSKREGDKNVARKRQKCRTPDDKNVAPSDKNVAPHDKNVAPSDKNVAPHDKNVAPFIYKGKEGTYKEDIRNTDRARIIPEDEKLFSEFWAAYPKKVDRKGSLKAFKNIPRLKEVFPQIMQALTIQKRSKQWNEQSGRFIPHPTTYIHQERWTAVNEADKQQEVIDKITQSALVNFGFISEGDAWDE